ncbi:MAG: anthranilate phosphoribosyltransferase [Verrucomicrobia bacterium]|nr:anthranilate phosphoribosyltransferase [Verrucomicrobiota bacterium]
MLADLLPVLARGEALSRDQVTFAVEALVTEAVSVEAKADFLTALARKGETPEEIAAFASDLRARSLPVPLDPATRAREILDVVGTGGDRLGTINLSTCAALICAAAGVVVAKHGNRAITSRTGSADLLEALGIPIELSPDESARALREHGFAFLFAPRYHPAFRQIAPARRLCAERGQRTIFNFLGPLLNPARPSAMLLGVPRPELCEPIARVLQQLGVRRAMVVCGRVDAGHDGQPAFLDELSPLGETTVAEFYQDRGFHVSVLSPAHFPLQPVSLADLVGGEAGHNARIARALLTGEDRGPRRDAVLLNAGAALFVAGRAGSITAGWELAADLVDQGAVAGKLRSLGSA